MSKLTLCIGLSCPIKEFCARYSRQAKETPNYISYPPFNHERKSCSQFEDTAPDIMQQLNEISNYEDPDDK